MMEASGDHENIHFDYDLHWNSKWDDMKKFGPISRHVRRIIKRVIRPLVFSSVLDVGCGQGSFLAELLTEFPDVRPCGVDISTAAIALAKRKVPYGRFWVLDVEKNHLGESFDLVICSEVLEHIPDDLSALKNLRLMTKDFLIISTLQGRMRRFEGQQAGHVRNYAPGELVEKVEKAGFTILRVAEWGFPFFSPLYRDFLEITGARGTTGQFGPIRKAIAKGLYILFSANSYRRGDEIFVLAKPSRDGE